MEIFNGTIAVAINVLRKARRGIVWAPGELSIVELKTVDAVIYEIAYCIVNPVASGLVWSPEDWPGLCTQVADIGRRTLAGTRPSFYFRPEKWGPEASHPVVMPAWLEDMHPDEARALLDAEVARQVALARLDIRSKGWRVLGPIAAKGVSPFKRAKTWEPFGELNPTFATGPGRRAERNEAAEELVAFRVAYRAAWLRYKAGETDVVFPYGTYRMRVRYHVRVAEPPT